MSIIAENIETAFESYRVCGGNISEAVKRIKKNGLKVSATTLTDWAKRYGWKERMERGDSQTVALQRFINDPQKTLLSELLTQAEAYKKFLSSGHGHDPQTVYAWLSCLRLAWQVMKKIPETETKLSAEGWQEMVDNIMLSEYGIDRRKEKSK
jgi:hypothetical protein